MQAGSHGVSRNVIIIDFMICFLFTSAIRVLVRLLREKNSTRRYPKLLTKTLLIGSAYSVNSLLQAFEIIPKKRQFIGIICNDLLRGKTLRNVKILGNIEKLAEICQCNIM